MTLDMHMTRAGVIGHLIDGLDEFLEKATLASKERARRPIEARMEKQLAPLFRRQGNTFLAGFAGLKAQLPEPDGAIKEAAKPLDWEKFYDKAATATQGGFEAAIVAGVEDALTLGAGFLIDELKLDVSFDLKNPRAVKYVKARGAENVTAINDTTREYLRTVITEGVDQGWGYARIATAIKDRFAEFADGTPITTSRAKLIAVTEIGNGYEQGSRVVADDLSDAGIEMEKSWLTAQDSSVDDICAGNEAEGWIPVDQAFSSGDQQPLAHPNCLPGFARITAGETIATSERFYDGDLVIIHTASGNHLACTPNHPILTPDGWIAAGKVDEVGYVISSGLSEWESPIDTHNKNVPTSIEDVVKAFRRSEHVRATPVPTTAEDFHGDGRGPKVTVVFADGCLLDDFDVPRGQHIYQYPFGGRDIDGRLLNSERSSNESVIGHLSPLDRLMSGSTVAPVFVGSSASHHEPVRIDWIADSDAPFFESGPNCSPGNSEALSQGILRNARLVEVDDFGIGQRQTADPHWSVGAVEPLVDGGDADALLSCQILNGSAGKVFTDKVIGIDREHWHGFVYNLETASSFYVAEGIITHNCRCTALFRRVGSQ